MDQENHPLIMPKILVIYQIYENKEYSIFQYIDN